MRQLDQNEASQYLNGSCLQGYVRASYDELVELFGAPIADPWDDYKTTVEWYLQAEDGTTASVYDYYTSGLSDRVYDWHIGGHSQRAAQVVQEALETKKSQV